jgi:DNA-binding phage protein
MSDDPRSLPYDTADYLETPGDIAEYLEVVMEEGDERSLRNALNNSVRAAKRVMPVEMAEFSDNPDEPSVNRLVSLLHALGFELSFRPKRAA